jgi:plasmid stabilization system protein ParE
MSRLIWSPPALQDVQRLHRFLATKNIDAAMRAVKAIRAGVTIIAQQTRDRQTLGGYGTGVP